VNDLAHELVGRATDIAGLGLGTVVLRPFFRWLEAARPDALARMRHELFAARGDTFVREAGVLEKAAFVAKMFGSDGGFDADSSAALSPTEATSGGEMLFAGDVLHAGGLGTRSFSSGLRARLAQASCFVVNVEGTVSTSSHEIAPFLTRRGLAQLLGYARDHESTGWVSRLDVDELRALLDGMPRIVASVANNHTQDDGLAGFDRTLALLRGLGHEVVGDARTDDGAVCVDVGPHRVGLFAAGYGTNYAAGDAGCLLRFDDGPHQFAHARIRRIVERLVYEQGATHVIALLHWGHEHEHEPTLAQRDCARGLRAAGVSAVIGHHPHLLQRSEHAGRGWVSYSLGDFVGGDRTVWSRFGSLVSLRFGPKGAVVGEVIPTVQTPFWKQQQTMLLDEAPRFERAVFARFFQAKLP
jgi:Bacterial capsule synthesis protein PGA_cap